MKMNESIEGTVNILLECPELIASVRVGVLEPLTLLQDAGKCKIVYKRTIDITRIDVEWCDILITVRGYEYVTWEIVKAAKKAGRYIIYFLDDDLLHIPEDIPSGKYFRNPEIKEVMINILGISNILWCVNSRIGEIYSKYCNGNWILSKVPVDLNKKSKESYEDNDIIHVLYAGSSDHSKAIQKYISPAVKKLCKEYKNKVDFTFIGADPNLKKIEKVKYISFINDYNAYKNIVQSGKFTIGLAIIQEDDFYKGKYYNKFIEYTSIGAVGIYTDNLPYTQIIENGQNGFLCNNDNWYETLKEAINNPELRERCYSNAQYLLQEKFNYEVVSDELETLIPELIMFHADKTKKVNLLNLRMAFYKNRLIKIWKKHKLLFLFFIFIKLAKFFTRKIKDVLDKIRRRI